MIQQVSNLFFPQYCLDCKTSLLIEEKFVCFACEAKIPRYSGGIELPQLFWGKTSIVDVLCYTYYLKGSTGDQIIKQFKYYDQKKLSKWIGMKLQPLIQEQIYDMISFIPMHRRKRKKRGYNQAEEMAKRLSQLTKIPSSSLLRKKLNNSSQTRKSRFHRHQESKTIYQCNNDKGNYKHILLVDDVITTGSTLEICSELLINKYQCKVTILAFAYTPDDHILLHAS